MIVRSIFVAHWRCFAESVNVGPFSEHINVIHAPNATGKSTLFEAFRRALLDSHRVSGQEISTIRPHGRQLSPLVKVEFHHEGTEYRITKQFLDGAKSILERKENQRFVPWYEGASADQWCQAILTRSQPGRGLFKSEHWGLAQVLWVPQDGIQMIPLSQDVIENIHTYLGAQVSNTEAAPLERRIDALHSEYFTSTGKLKSGRNAPSFVHMQDEIESLKKQKALLQEQLQSYEDSSRSVQDLRARREVCKARIGSLRQQLFQLRKQEEKYNKRLSDKKQQEEREKAFNAKYEQIVLQIDSVSRSKREAEEHEARRKKLEKDLALQQRERDGLKKDLDDAQSSLENIRKSRPLVDQAEKAAEQARLYHENMQKADVLQERLQKIEECRQQIQQLQDEQNHLLAPDTRKLNATRKAVQRLNEVKLQIEAMLITLEIVPFVKGTLNPIVSEETKPIALKPHVPVQVKGSPEVVVEWPGFARIRATGPAGDIEVYRQEYADCQKEVQRLTETFGTDDVDQLEQLCEKSNELKQQIKVCQGQMEILLAEEKQEEIVQKKTKLELTIQQLLSANPGWSKKPPQAQKLRSEAERAKSEFIEQIETAERKRDGIQNLFTAASEKVIQYRSSLEEVQKQLSSLQTKIAHLTQDGKSESEREGEKRNLLRDLEAVRVLREDAEKDLSEFGHDPKQEVERIEKQLESAQKESDVALEKEKSEEGRLAHISSQSPYSHLAQVEEKIESLTEKAKREEERVEAIHLLCQTLSVCRSEAIAAVTGPVERIASRILGRIAGGRIGRIKLDETFVTYGVHPEIFDTSVSMDSLSGGEKEQCYFATRIALAEVLAKEERQLVVLDDSMVFSDAMRFSRILTILEEAAQNLQILILTCHPERYVGLKQATSFDLEKIVIDVQNN